MARTILNEAITNTMDKQTSINWGFLIAGIFVFLFFQSDRSGAFMLIMIRNMQLIQYAPLFRFPLQANMIDALNIIRPILQFDVIGDIIDFLIFFELQ